MFTGRFLANEFNLAGTNKFEHADADMYVDQSEDLKAEWTKYKAASFVGDLPHSFKIFDTKLHSTNTGYLIGKSLTWADLAFFDAIDKTYDQQPNVFKHYPAIEKHHNLIKSVPNVAKWLASRPVTSM